MDGKECPMKKLVSLALCALILLSLPAALSETHYWGITTGGTGGTGGTYYPLGGEMAPCG